ncbi:hypothetical protein N431DRAFT_222481 [Stipitochalara longipes BDJ]|nr:hypothetical protein N431DRAFT_222481 [Stipitochalara longipes BDJ]
MSKPRDCCRLQHHVTIYIGLEQLQCAFCLLIFLLSVSYLVTSLVVNKYQA